MSNVTHHASRSKPEVSDQQSKELAEHYQRRLAFFVAQAVLVGERSIRPDELLWRRWLHRKRKSIQQATLAMAVAPLRSTGVLPCDFEVIW
jgi:hypothetical protein